MVEAKSILAALALSPLASFGALAQNGYSFTDAANSAVRYSAAPAKPVLACAAVTGLATAETTVVSVRVVPAADGVPEHCRVTGLIQPEKFGGQVAHAAAALPTTPIHDEPVVPEKPASAQP